MKRGFTGLAALGLMLAAFLLATVPAGAQSVDDKIKALEQELSSLKSQQMELKKEATAATAALPSFSYRPGNGVNIEAADKSWGLRFSLESHFRMLFESGQDQVGRTNGEIMLRRWRPYFWYCLDNCLYEFELGIDMDGFGTGNAKNSTNTATSSIMQRGVVHFHLENLNPFMPTVDVGGDISTAFSTIRQGSSAVGSQMEYDLLSRNYGPNTGRAGWGIVSNWDDRQVGPGRITRFQIAYASINSGDDNLSQFSDKKSWNTFIGYQPFSQLKNKWIRGLQFELGAWFCNLDDRPQADNGCDRLRIQDNGDAARQTLFDTGEPAFTSRVNIFVAPGFQWEVGPYRLRLFGSKLFTWNAKDNPVNTSNALSGKKFARGWLIGHDLFIWSPKGFLTGSAATPGSVLLGTHFERNDVACDVPRCQSGAGAPGTLSQFHRGTYIVREWDVFYFLAPRMSVGAHFLWYDASNLTTTVQRNLGIHKNGRVGGGGDWWDWNLNFRYQF
jgi:hypothetical protein